MLQDLLQRIAGKPLRLRGMAKLGLGGGALACYTAFLSLGLALSANASGEITEFDIPGATFGTFPVSISEGMVTGYWQDNNSVFHGFLRAPGGTITTFDPSGSVGTFPESVNADGEVLGFYRDANVKFHGFIRTADGTITTFDKGKSPRPYSLNSKGKAAGYFFDKNTRHGFERNVKGKTKTFDPPGSVDTEAFSINKHGTITGSYYDSGGANHSFVRAADGSFTNFDVPGQTTYTNAWSIGNQGSVTGYYGDSNGYAHGFVRAADGTITTFDVAGAIDTAPLSINGKGQVTGYWQDPHQMNLPRGFVRAADGTITIFDAPDAYLWTSPTSIDEHGSITGNWRDSNLDWHGFVRSP